MLDSTLLANYARKFSYLHANASKNNQVMSYPFVTSKLWELGFEFKCITISTVVSPKEIFPYSFFIFLSRSCKKKKKGLMLRDFVHYKILQNFGVSSSVFIQLLCQVCYNCHYTLKLQNFLTQLFFYLQTLRCCNRICTCSLGTSSVSLDNMSCKCKAEETSFFSFDHYLGQTLSLHIKKHGSLQS